MLSPSLLPVDDGRKIRDAHVWAIDKLEIVRQYLPRFGNACKNRAPTFYLVDGFAGPGINRIKETGELVWGTPLLGLQSQPEFSSCVFMDYGKKNVQSLKARTEMFGPRAIVERGDSNVDLIPLMREHVNERCPSLVLLDPEGGELSFDTVLDIAKFRKGKFKAEQLILLATHTGFMRGLFLKKPPPKWAPEMMHRVFGTDGWTAIYERRLNEDISSGEAVREYVDLYRYQIKYKLGYEWVLARPIREKGWTGRVLYFLVFATDHRAGHDIMDHIFKTVVGERPPAPEPYQRSLFDDM
jgi:three-Cys-motif partner protein